MKEGMVTDTKIVSNDEKLKQDEEVIKTKSALNFSCVLNYRKYNNVFFKNMMAL